VENRISFPQKEKLLSYCSSWEKEWIVLCCGKSHQFSTKGKLNLYFSSWKKRLVVFVLWKIVPIFHEGKTQIHIFLRGKNWLVRGKSDLRKIYLRTREIIIHRLFNIL
jgi:hypothetical protein